MKRRGFTKRICRACAFRAEDSPLASCVKDGTPNIATSNNYSCDDWKDSSNRTTADSGAVAAERRRLKSVRAEIADRKRIEEAAQA